MHQIWVGVVKDIPHARPLKGSADFHFRLPRDVNKCDYSVREIFQYTLRKMTKDVRRSLLTVQHGPSGHADSEDMSKRHVFDMFEFYEDRLSAIL